MKDSKKVWQKLGRIISPSPKVPWMSTYTGAACAEILNVSTGLIRIYITGRDDLNRSSVGYIELSLSQSSKVIHISTKGVLTFGELGSFDENGVSYPYLVKTGSDHYLYYTGWSPTVLTPFQNDVGLAIRNKSGAFSKVSRAPILCRTNEDPLGIGSVAVINDDGDWKMWYTSFLKWKDTKNQPKHFYHIKYATSKNGIDWERENTVCISFKNKNEFAIARPTVIKIDNAYHMWYCYRGQEYKIGYAHSEDGISWNRRDDLVGFGCSAEGWDSKAVCYPYVFKFQNYLYLLYCGNNYGKEGLGLARLPL